eukprot:366296-Pleurochrysis_carterae.AAC.1
MLKKKWLPAVIDIFRKESDAATVANGNNSASNGDADSGSPLLSAVSALMFNQLRGLLTASIEAYLAYFEQYATNLPDDPEQLHSEDVSTRPLLVVRMLVEGEGFKFAPSAAAVVKSLLSTIDHFVTMMNTIPRIEGELGKSGGSARLLVVANVDEEIVTSAKARLHKIVEMNMSLTDHMVQAYTPYAYLLSGESDKKVDDFNKAKHSLPETTAEIAKYDKSVKEIAKRSLPEVRFNLVLVACQAVKTKLVARGDELSGRLRGHIGSGFLARCSDTCARYQDIFLRLGMHPNTEEEMVQLEAFLQARRVALQTHARTLKALAPQLLLDISCPRIL